MKQFLSRTVFFMFLWVILSFSLFQSNVKAQYCVDEKIAIDCNQIIGIDNLQDDLVLFRLNCLKQQVCGLCIPDFLQISYADKEGRLLIIDEKSIQSENVDLKLMKSGVPCDYSNLWIFRKSLPERQLYKITDAYNISYLNPIRILLMEPNLNSLAKKMTSLSEIFFNNLKKSKYFSIVNSNYIADPSGNFWSFSNKPDFLSVSKYLDPQYRFVMAIHLTLVDNGSDYLKIYLWDREENIMLTNILKTYSWTKEAPSKIPQILQNLYLDLIIRNVYAQDNP